MSIKAFPLRPFATMSIRTKLIVSAVITIGLALTVAFTVFLSSRSMEEAATTDRFAVRVIQDVSDLNSLSYAYLLLKDKRPKVQWQLKHASLGKVLSERIVGSGEEKELLARLRSNHEQIKRLFDVVSARVEESRTADRNHSSSYDELNEGVTAQLMARAEMMSNDASLLGRESGRHRDTVRRISSILVLASTLILIVSAALTAFFLAKSIGGSIRGLEKGTQRIAAGDLAYRVALTGNDEISRLSAAFNEMTAKLAASHDRLEEEVAEQKRAQEAIRRQAELIELSHEAIFVRDLDSRIIFWNRGAEETYGWTKAEALGNITQALLKAQFPVPFDEHMASLMAKDRWEGELVHTRKDGARITVLSRHALQRDETGRPAAILEINVDITERKEAQESLQRAYGELEMRVEERTKDLAAANRSLAEGTRQLEETNRELESFSYSVSHDLRAPLRAIDGFSKMLEKDLEGSLAGETKRKFETIQRNAQQMGQLIDDLLAFSRLGRAPLEMRPVNMGRLAHGVIDEQRSVNPGRDLRITVDSVPAAWGDSTLLRQAFVNLISNAIKFTRSRETAVIEVGGRSDGEEHVYYVKDNGVGFDMTYADKLFGVFQRLHTTREFEGTGVGLAIVQRIVHRHGGRVWAEGHIGEGATLYFSLPERRQHEEQPEQPG